MLGFKGSHCDRILLEGLVLIRTAIFAPAAVVGVWESSIKSLVSQLIKDDQEIFLIRCKGLYVNICVAMPAFGISEISPSKSKQNICLNCMKSQEFSDLLIPSQIKHLESYINEKNIMDLEMVLNEINIKNWFNFEIDGLRIGQIASYEFFLNHKIKSLHLLEQQWDGMLLHIKNVLYTYFAARNFFQENLVDNFIVYNRLYSINNIFSQVAEKNGVRVFSIQNEGPAFNVNSKFHVFSNVHDQLWLSQSDQWANARNRPLNPIKVHRVNKHLKFVLGIQGTPTYSNSANPELSRDEILFRLDLRPSSKKILIPSSSADERFALETLEFLPIENTGPNDSLQILKEIVALSPYYPDYDFIFRIHPREFPNRRENVQSPHGLDLLEFIKKEGLPVNLKVNTPEHQIPIANLAMVSDFIFNGTSSVGLDFAALGLNVVAFSPTRLFVYPPEINYSQSDLKSCLVLVASLPANVAFPSEKQALAYRWIYFKYFTNNRNVGLLNLVSLERLDGILKRYFSPTVSRWVCKILANLAKYIGVNKDFAIIGKKLNPSYEDTFNNMQVKRKSRILSYSLFYKIESSLISQFSSKLKTNLYPLSNPPASRDAQ